MVDVVIHNFKKYSTKSSIYYSRKCILFMGILVKLGTIFTMVPNFDFRESKIKNKKWIYIVPIAIFLYFFLFQFLVIASKYIPYINLLEWLNIIEIISLFCFFVINSSSRKQWETIFKAMALLEESKYLNTAFDTEKSMKKSPYIWNFVGYIIYSFVVLFITVIIATENSVFVTITYALLQLYGHTSRIIMYLITSNMAVAIKYKYEDTVKLLSRTRDEINSIDTVRDIYMILHNAVETYDEIFKNHVIFLIGANCSIIVMYSMHGGIIPSHFLSVQVEMHKEGGIFILSLVISAIFGILMLFAIVSVTWTCKSAMNKAKNITKLSFEMISKLKHGSEEYKQLKGLIFLTTQNETKFGMISILHDHQAKVAGALSACVLYFFVQE